MDNKTLGVDHDPHANDDAKAVIQEIVWDLMRRFQGEDADPVSVGAALNEALAQAGLPEQPRQWVEATSLEIAGGREVVMDVTDQVEPEQVQIGDETVNVLAPPTGIPDAPGAPRPAPQHPDSQHPDPQPTPQERAAE